MDNSIITSKLPFNYDIYKKFTKIDIDFKSVLGLEDQEFSKFIKANWRNEKKPIKLSDIKKLYHIEKLQTHDQTLWSMLRNFGLACVGILLFFVTLKIARYLWKCSKECKMKNNQQMNLLECKWKSYSEWKHGNPWTRYLRENHIISSVDILILPHSFSQTSKNFQIHLCKKLKIVSIEIPLHLGS